MPGTDPTTLPNFQRYWDARDTTDAAGYVRGGATAPTGFRRNLSLAIRAGTAATLVDSTGGGPGTPQFSQMGGPALAFDPSFDFSIGGLNATAIAAELPGRANYTNIFAIRAPMSHGAVATPSSTAFANTWPGSCGRCIWLSGTGGGSNNIASGWCDEMRRVLSFHRDGVGATNQALSGFTCPASWQLFAFTADGTNHTVSAYRNGVVVAGTASAPVIATGTVNQFYLGYGGAGTYAWRGGITRGYQYSATTSGANLLAAFQFIADEMNTLGYPVKHAPTTKLTIIGDSIAGGAHSDRCENWVNMLDVAVGANVLVDLQAVEGADVDTFADAAFFASTVGNADNDRGFTFSSKVALIALGANWLRQISASRITAATWFATYTTLIGRLRSAGYGRVYGVVPIGIGNAVDPDAQETLRLTYRSTMRASPLFDGVIDTLGTVFHPHAATLNAVGQCVAGAAYQIANGTTGVILDGTNNGIGTAIGLDGIHLGPIGQGPYCNMILSHPGFRKAMGLSSTVKQVIPIPVC